MKYERIVKIKLWFTNFFAFCTSVTTLELIEGLGHILEIVLQILTIVNECYRQP